MLGARLRAVLGVAGALGGLCAWLLADVYGPEELTPRLHLFLTFFAGTFFGALLVAIGPLRFWRAVMSALGLSAVVAGLVLWASYRYAAPAMVLRATETMLAAGLLATLPLPFVIAAGMEGRSWRDYPTLFSQAWSIVTRYASAWLFVAVVWAVVFLSDQLFQLVGITLLRDLMRIDWVPWVLAGTALGVGLAVVDELHDYISPFLLLRLMRIILPVVTLVVLVFLVALPLRGLGNLFGQLSVAGTLLVMAAAAATLVTTALDRCEEEAVSARFMLWSVQLLALMMPALAFLGGWAVWLRVQEHGLTPARIAGLVAAGVLLAYGLSFGVSVLLRGDWAARIRRDNRALALMVIVLAALWLTPALNADRIAAQNRVERFKAGTTPAGAMDLYYLKTGLGLAGRRALDDLRALSKQDGQGALAQRFADLDAGRLAPGSPREPADVAKLRARLAKELAVRPEGDANEAIKSAILSTRSVWQLKLWDEGCSRHLDTGQPGCVLAVGDYLPDRPGQEALLLMLGSDGKLQIAAFAHRDDGELARVGGARQIAPGGKALPAGKVIAQVLAGKTDLTPARINALDIGGLQLMVQP